MNELRPIPDCPGYFARSDGVIISKKYGHEVILKTWTARNGYECVSISNGGKVKHRTVHRLIAITFLGLGGSLCVNHKDGNKHNNSIENLEFVTHKENEIHAVKNGLHRHPHHNGWCREVRLLDTLTGESEVFISIQKCAKKVGCSLSNVKHALYNGRVCSGRYIIEYTGYECLKNNNDVIISRREVMIE